MPLLHAAPLFAGIPPAVIQHLPWFAWIAIVGIVVGGVTGMISAYFTHRERMAMIRMGIHPDAKPDPALTVEKEYYAEDAEL